MLTKREVEEIAKRAERAPHSDNALVLRTDIPALIASLREAIEALEEEHREHHDNQIARSVGKTSRLLSLWNQVPSETSTDWDSGNVTLSEEAK